MNGVGGSPPAGSCSLPSVPTVSPLLSSPSLAPLLQVFSNEGQFKFRFGVRGRSPGQLQRPTGVAVDTNGDIIVADYDNRWVSIFSPEGKFKVRGLRSLSSAALVASLTDLFWCLLVVRAWTGRSILSLSFCFGARLGLLSPPGSP